MRVHERPKSREETPKEGIGDGKSPPHCSKMDVRRTKRKRAETAFGSPWQIGMILFVEATFALLR